MCSTKGSAIIIMAFFLSIAAVVFCAGCSGQKSGDISTELADKLTDSFSFSPGEKKSGTKPQEHAGDVNYPQVTDFTIPLQIYPGSFKINVSYTFSGNPADIAGVIVHVVKAGKYWQVPVTVTVLGYDISISGTFSGGISEIIDKLFDLEIAIIKKNGLAGNYKVKQITPKTGSNPSPSKQEVQDLISFPGNSDTLVVDNNNIPGESMTEAPKVLGVAPSKESVTPNEVFDLIVSYTGPTPKWLLLQVNGAQKFLQITLKDDQVLDDKVILPMQFNPQNSGAKASALSHGTASRALDMALSLNAALMSSPKSRSNIAEAALKLSDTPSGQDGGVATDAGGDGGVATDAGYDAGFDGGVITDAGFYGRSWTQAFGNFTARVGHPTVVFNNKIWLVGGNSDTGTKNDVWHSADGKSWAPARIDGSAGGFTKRTGHSAVVFDNKIWVIGGDTCGDGCEANDVWWSADGALWTQAKPNDANGFPARYLHTSVSFGGKMWVIGGYSNGMLNDVWYSTNGVDWTQAKPSDRNGFSQRYLHSSEVFNGKMWVTGGYGTYTSDGGTYYDYFNDVWYSTDGTTWTPAKPNDNNGFSARTGQKNAVLNGKLWVIGGQIRTSEFMNDVWWSADGASWTQAKPNDANGFSSRSDHSVAAFLNRLWVIGGWACPEGCIYLNDVWSSADGTTWTAVNTGQDGFSSRYGPVTLSYNDKLWLISGQIYGMGMTDEVWNSNDGVNWTLVEHAFSFLPRYAASGTVYDGRMWIIGGNAGEGGHRNDVWYSTDGFAWTQALPPDGGTVFAERESHSTLVYDGGMWVIGGWGYAPGQDGGYGTYTTLNDVWHSTNGMDWTQAKPNDSNGFPSRTCHSSVVFDGKMWVIGGFNYGGGSIGGARTVVGGDMNDTWYSTDGTTWTKAKPDDMNGFSARDSHSSVVIDGKMWVIGGQTCPNGCSYLNDVWFSEDGITWINAKPDDVSGFFARKDFGAATFGDKMWVLTGYYYDDLIYEYYFGDVWYSDRR